MIQELIAPLESAERDALLADGEKYPFPTRVLVRGLQIDKQPELASSIVSLYRRLVQAGSADGHANDLKGLIVEKLGRSSTALAHESLRALFPLDPSRHDQVARALADHPTDVDLPILIDALLSQDSNTTTQVARALLKIKASPSGPEGLGNLIRLGRRVGPSSRSMVNELAMRWTGGSQPLHGKTFEGDLAAWEAVYRRRFPTAAPLNKAEGTTARTYNMPQLIDQVIRGDVMKTASAKRGEQVLVKTRCLDCHKFGEKGAGLGPDLTTVNSRFQPAEILESIVLPSKVISDQYKSVTLATQDGKVYSGMPVVTDGTNLVLLLSDGTKVNVPKSDIDEQKASATSVMPEGLLGPLTDQDIADLLALFNSMPRVAAPEAPAGKTK
jgi:putative heme-binding domain-containing protein